MGIREINVKGFEKWIVASLGYIEEKNCDALLLGGFTGSVIELLGRCMRLNPIKEYQKCYSDFLKKYLPKYYLFRNILYGILRSEGAHAILAQSGVSLTCGKNEKKLHLKGHYDPIMDRKSLIIYSPEFMKDLTNAVKSFFSDIDANQDLKNKFDVTINDIYTKGQDIINQEEERGLFIIEHSGEMIGE